MTVFYLMTCLVLSLASAAEPDSYSSNFKDKYGLSLQAIYYMDDRDFNTLAVTTAVSKLPYNVSFWGFTDFHGSQASSRDRRRLIRSFSEYRLSYSLEEITGIKGLGLETEYNYFSTSDKSIWRFGPVYKHAIPFLRKGSWLKWRVHPLQSDKNWQASVIYRVSLSEKWSMSGFADYNINSGPDRWILEPQLNYQINKNLSLHLEYRHNGFEDANKNLRGNGVAIGVGVKF